MAQTQIVFEGKDAALLEAYRRQIREQEKVNAGLEKMVESSKRAGTAAEDTGNKGAESFMRFAGQIVGITSVMGAAMSAIEAIKAEYQQLLEIERNAAAAQVAAGGDILSLLPNVQDDPTMRRADVVDRLNAISRETGANFSTVSQVASIAFSNRGSLSNQAALDATQTALEFNPVDAGGGGALASRMLNFMNATGNADPQVARGFMMQLQANMPVPNLQLLGQNVNPKLFNLMAGGASAEEGAELIAAMATAMGDQTGSVSATGAVQLQKNLADFIPQGDDAGRYLQAQGLWARLGVLQSSPELQAQAMESMQFPTETGNIQRALIRGELPDIVAAAQAGITPYGVGHRELAVDVNREANAIPQVQQLRREQQLQVEVEQLRMGRDVEGMNAMARRILRDIESETDVGGPLIPDVLQEFVRRDNVAGRQMWRGENLPQAIAGQLRSDLTVGPSSARHIDDKDFVERLLPILDDLARSIDAVNQTPLPAQQHGRAD